MPLATLLRSAIADAMSTAELDGVEAFDPHDGMSADEFRAEIERRNAAALADPNSGTEWSVLRARIERDSDD